MAKVKSTKVSPRIRNLSSLAGILAERARIYRVAHAGELKPGDMTKYSYVLSQMRDDLETIQMISRIEVLEELVNAQG